MTLPFVSCICPTYNRPPAYQYLLEEAIECFLRQDYPADRRDLMILNDAPGQELVCDLPNVHVINHTPRFTSLGEKYNWLLNMADAIVVIWEDDDISLPHRISQAVDRLRSQGEPTVWFTYFNPQRTWFMDQRGLHSTHAHGVCHNASAFWKNCGFRYPPISGAQDAEMDRRLKTTPTARPLSDDPSAWSYIYRFGQHPVHLSGRTPHDEFYVEIGRLPITPGRYVLRPHWRQDYVELTRAACRQSPSTSCPT